jgi:hypothetical protein
MADVDRKAGVKNHGFYGPRQLKRRPDFLQFGDQVGIRDSVLGRE